MAPIRASEIGSYLYCARAWWYQRRGVVSANQSELSGGTQLHHQHGRTLLTASLWRLLAFLLLLISILLLVSYCTAQVI
jgi:hypothetical protein